MTDPGNPSPRTAPPGGDDGHPAPPLVVPAAPAEAWREQVEAIELILGHADDMIMIMRTDGTAEYLSPSVERVLGWGISHLDGRSAYEMIHPNDRRSVGSTIDLTIRNRGATATGRFRAARSDGTFTWLEGRSTALAGRGDAVVVVARDISAEMRARSEARDQETRYKRMLAESPLGIAIFVDRSLVYANPAACSMLGAVGPDELSGIGVDALLSAEAPPHRGTGAKVIATGESIGPIETSITRLDGSSLDAEVTVVPTIWKGLQAVQAMVADISERRRAEALLRHAALHDPLTGLPNRHLLADRIEQAALRARRTGHHSVMLFCDLDRFKVVNDALGHAVGDELLAAVARRLRACVRETDTVARFGGDEFVLLSEDLTDDVDATVLVRRVQSMLERPFPIGGRELHVTISTGVVHINGDESTDEILRNADTAMYVAKEAGRNRAIVFDAALRARASDRLRIEAELRSSLSGGAGIEMYLQPEVALATRDVVGYEALVRWRGSDRAVVAPDHFLPIAAEAGLMHHLGRHMVGCVTQALSSMRSAGSDLWIALNTSPEELEHPLFSATILEHLDQLDLSGARLCIEITEHSIMRDPAGVENALAPLRARGVSVAIDDFGTGYSSLAYLSRFAPEFLKIDREFTAGIAGHRTELAVVEAILQLATSLGIVCVAEGIETEEQAAILTELGCQLGQGWLFGHPAPASGLIGAG